MFIHLFKYIVTVTAIIVIKKCRILFTEIGSVTSPFYPISNPNQKTPSPYEDEKSRAGKITVGLDEFLDTSQNRAPKYAEKPTLTRAFDISQFNNAEDKISITVSTESESFKGSLRKLYTHELEDDLETTNDKPTEKNMGRTSGNLRCTNMLLFTIDQTDIIISIFHHYGFVILLEIA